MYYYSPALQRFAYTITATANGNTVTDFTLFVTDDVSQITQDAATEKRFTTTVDNFAVDANNRHIVKYTVFGGLPKASVVNEEDPSTYVIEPDTGEKVPIALPKPLKFKAEKDGYEKSITYPKEITVLGELPVGGAQKIVSIPNVNYSVLHDPPGDNSYAYLDDSLTIKGILRGMQLQINDTKIPVYPSPWSSERTIKDVYWEDVYDTNPNSPTYGQLLHPQVQKDLGNAGLLGYRDSDSTLGWFALNAVTEAGTGAGIVALGPAGYALQLVKVPILAGVLADGPHLQYEVSPNRHIETPSGDELPDLMGPGKGDIYFGEGWTLGMQTKYLLGIKKEGDAWAPYTQTRLTYDILDRTNQYVYTIRDIENIITDLTATIATITEDSNEKTQLAGALDAWKNLLNKNLAYQWYRSYVHPEGENHDKYVSEPQEAFDEFRTVNGLPPDEKGEGESAESGVETLIFSAGPTYEYSRTIAEADVVSYSIEVAVGTDVKTSSELNNAVGFVSFGTGTKMEWNMGGEASVSTGTGLGAEYESGQESEQTVGFVLQDDDIGDNYATRVYEDPGIITSAPWDYGTNRGVDMTTELVDRKLLFSITSDADTLSHELDNQTLSEELKQEFQTNGAPLSDNATASVELRGSFWQIINGNKIYIVKKEQVQLNIYQPQSGGTFDYRAGAHYKVKINYTGQKELESSSFAFVAYAPQVNNPDSLTVMFNGMGAPYGGIDISKEAPTATITVSLYPPAIDINNSPEKEYSVDILVASEGDSQINRVVTLKPRFADLRAPRANITAPYDGQRISPEVFKDDKKFKIEVFSDEQDLAKIELQRRSKGSDGVWEPWPGTTVMTWEDGGENPNVEVVTHSDRAPVRRVFTFNWDGTEIATLGVGEYALRAVAQDKATKLQTDGSQAAKPNIDLDAPIVTFQVDGSKPTVLTTTPNYQARESERIYRSELSVLFNDDMRAGDFSDRTFYVTDLLNNSDKVPGFVSYSPALRKAIFVPVVPFQPNGFFRVEIKTDTEKDGNLEKGVHDLAGNPLDNAFMFTFRTTDAPFEETWSIILAATDGTSIDANNIAAVEYGALDAEDEKDALAVPHLDAQLNLSFLDRSQVEFDRDIRPADGRLGHHWFFAIKNAQTSPVQIFWNPSTKLRTDARQYQVMRLVEFDANGNVTETKNLDPKDAPPITQFPIGEGALQFSGTNDYVEVNYNPDLNPDQFTVCCWVKVEGGQGIYRPAVTSSHIGGIGYKFWAGIDDKWQFGTGKGGGWNELVGPNVSLNQWTHIAGTFDGQNMTLYVDGNTAGTLPNVNYSTNTYLPLRIGSETITPVLHFFLNGQIDEVSVWNHVLSQSAIETYMNRSLAGNEAGLVGYWTFEEGSGTTTADQSPNGNDGTLNGNPNWTMWTPPSLPPPPDISGALAYEYTPAQGEAVRFFRLDVQKVGFVVTTFENGSSGWKFLSVPITPQRADPFVNLGDDIDPFKLYKYDTNLSGYKIYPLDIGEVGLQTGHGYFTRLSKDVEVDVGGPSNLDAKVLELKDAGWHAIGNPFVKAVSVADLQVKKGSETKTFADAASAFWIERTLYRWKIGSVGAQSPTDTYEAVTDTGEVKQLAPWDGYWFKTKFADITLIIPAPAGLANHISPLPESFKPPMVPSEGGLVNAAGQFELKLALTSDFASDLTTTLGARQNAKVGFDRFDQSEPPRLNHTVSAYFDHSDWEEATALKNGAGRRYNIDYQSLLEIGQNQVWNLVVYTDKPKAKMRLSWEKAIEQVPSDIMLSIRKAEGENTAWQDMRQVQFVDLDTPKFITKETFEIRAERFEMAPLEALKVIAGEKQVKLQWTASDNPFITGYTIFRHEAQDSILASGAHQQLAPCKHLESNVNQFIDTDVEEDATYTYQVSVHFKSGAELKSNLFTVTVLPVIKKTVLLQSYPNPFNPDAWIPYELKKESPVTIEIYNVAGQLVRTLELGVQPRGRYISKEKSAHWNGRNEFGERTASGVYFYVMKAGNFSATRKMMIVK